MKITKCIQPHSFQTSTITPIFYCSYRCVYYLCIHHNFFKEICRKKRSGKLIIPKKCLPPEELSFFSQNLLKVFPKKMQSNVYYQRENAEKPRKRCFTNHRITPEIVRWSPLFIGYSDVLQYFPQHMKNWKNSVENTLWCQTSLKPIYAQKYVLGPNSQI